MPITVDYQPDAALAGEVARLAGQGQFAQNRDKFNLQLQQFEQQLALKRASLAEQSRQANQRNSLAYNTLNSRNTLARDLAQLRAKQQNGGLSPEEAFKQRLELQNNSAGNQFQRDRANNRDRAGLAEDGREFQEKQNEQGFRNSKALQDGREDNKIDGEGRAEQRRQDNIVTQNLRSQGTGAWNQIRRELANGTIQNQAQLDAAKQAWQRRYGRVLPNGPPNGGQEQVAPKGPPQDVVAITTNEDGSPKIPGVTPDMLGDYDADGNWVEKVSKLDFMNSVMQHKKQESRKADIARKEGEAKQKAFDADLASGMAEQDTQIRDRVNAKLEKAEDYEIFTPQEDKDGVMQDATNRAEFMQEARMAAIQDLLTEAQVFGHVSKDSRGYLHIDHPKYANLLTPGTLYFLPGDKRPRKKN